MVLQNLGSYHYGILLTQWAFSPKAALALMFPASLPYCFKSQVEVLCVASSTFLGMKLPAKEVKNLSSSFSRRIYGRGLSNAAPITILPACRLIGHMCSGTILHTLCITWQFVCKLLAFSPFIPLLPTCCCFRAEDSIPQAKLCMGASEGLTSVLPNLGMFSFKQGVAFHPDPSKRKGSILSQWKPMKA